MTINIPIPFKYFAEESYSLSYNYSMTHNANSKKFTTYQKAKINVVNPSKNVDSKGPSFRSIGFRKLNMMEQFDSLLM